MVYGNIGNSRLYAGLGPDFKEAFDFLAAGGFSTAAPGRYELKGGMYYMVQKYRTKPLEEGAFEAHRKYTDIQYVVSGRERHGFAPLKDMKTKTPYDAGKDVEFLDGTGGVLFMEAGFFAVYFPDDAHMPNIRAGDDPEDVVKIVVKIPFTA